MVHSPISMVAKPTNKIRNIGPTTAKRLASIGIHSRDDIVRMGADEVYQRLRAAYGKSVTLNALWALKGAEADVDWRVFAGK